MVFVDLRGMSLLSAQSGSAVGGLVVVMVIFSCLKVMVD